MSFCRFAGNFLAQTTVIMKNVNNAMPSSLFTVKKIKFYSKKLGELLDEENIEHYGVYSFLGYNPPFEVFNRRNEITVELKSIQLSY